MSFGKKFVKNSLFGVIEFAWPILLSLIVLPITVNKLGVNGYGILSIVSVTLGFFGLLDLGLNLAAVRDIAEHYEKKDYSEINRVLSSILLTYLIIGLLGAIAIILSTDFLINNILNIPVEYLPVSKIAFYIAALGFLINMLVGVLGSIPKALQRYDISAKVSIFFVTLTSILTLAILLLGHGLKEIVLLNLTISILSGLTYYLIAKKILPEVKIKLKFYKDIFYRLFKFGGFFFITSVSGVILMQLDKLLIGSLISISLVTFYVVPSSIAQRIQGLITSSVNILLPVTSALSGTGQKEKLINVYRSVSKTVLFVATTISVPLFIFSEKFLLYWVGKDFAINSSAVMMYLVPTYFILGVISVPWNICLGVGRSKINAFFSVSLAFLNVILIFLFYKPFGLNGVAAAYFISVLTINPVAIYYIEKKIIGLSGFEFWRIAYKILSLGLIQGIVSLSLVSFAHSFLQTITLMSISMIILPILYYLFKMYTPEEKKIFINLISKFSFKAKIEDSN